MAVAALVLGIVSVALFIISLGSLSIVTVFVGIVGIILGALARKDPEKKSIASAGLILSIIGAILSVVGLIACTCMGIAIMDAGTLS